MISKCMNKFQLIATNLVIHIESAPMLPFHKERFKVLPYRFDIAKFRIYDNLKCTVQDIMLSRKRLRAVLFTLAEEVLISSNRRGHQKCA